MHVGDLKKLINGIPDGLKVMVCKDKYGTVAEVTELKVGMWDKEEEAFEPSDEINSVNSILLKV